MSPRARASLVRLATIAVASATVAPCIARAQGAFPDPPRIVHTLTATGASESWLVETRLSGDEPRRLFAVPHHPAGPPIPALSPDGRWLAYAVLTASAPRNAGADLVVVDLLGGATRTLARRVDYRRPVFDRFGLELYATRVRHLPPPRPSAPDQPPFVRPPVHQLIAISMADASTRDLAVTSPSRLEVVGVTRHGDVVVVRDDPRDAAIAAVDPQSGTSRVVVSLGRAIARAASLSSTDDRVLFARSSDRAHRRWEIVLATLEGDARVLHRAQSREPSPVRVGDTVMFADARGAPLRTVDLEGHEIPRTQIRETTTRHRVIASSPDGRITVMRRDTPQGFGFVVLDREASFAMPITEGGVVVDVAGFR